MTRPVLVRPWLHRTHPNFAILLAFTTLGNLWAGITGVHGDDTDFRSDLLEPVNDFAAPSTWGWCYLAATTLLIVGLCRPTFTVARAGLAAALALWLLRGALLIDSAVGPPATGYTLPLYLMVIGLHFAQTLEPPRNEETSR